MNTYLKETANWELPTADFDPDAFISPDSIRIFVTEPQENEWGFGTLESSQALRLYVDEGRTYFLEIQGIRTDTIMGTAEVASKGRCCTGYRLVEVRRNGEVICSEECEGVVEVEI